MQRSIITNATAEELKEMIRDVIREELINVQPRKNGKLKSSKELAAHLGVTVQTIIRYKKAGKIPFLQIGAVPRFDLEAVLWALAAG